MSYMPTDNIRHLIYRDHHKLWCILTNVKKCYKFIFSSPELAQGELLGYRDVRQPSYVWTSVMSETYETSETFVRQLFSLCTL